LKNGGAQKFWRTGGQRKMTKARPPKNKGKRMGGAEGRRRDPEQKLLGTGRPTPIIRGGPRTSRKKGLARSPKGRCGRTCQKKKNNQREGSVHGCTDPEQRRHKKLKREKGGPKFGDGRAA